MFYKSEQLSKILECGKFDRNVINPQVWFQKVYRFLVLIPLPLDDNL